LTDQHIVVASAALLVPMDGLVAVVVAVAQHF
jgi:hypothetical protein